MTESTQTIEQLQAEIAALKEQRAQELEMAAAQPELDQPKAGKFTESTVGNSAIAG